MGSDNNCNNYYNVVQNSGSDITSTPYYQTLSSSQEQSPLRNTNNTNNDWMSPEHNSEMNCSSHESESSSQHDQAMRESEMNARRTYNHPSSQQHLQMPGHPPWSFPIPYKRFYGDNHYGIAISPNVSQQSSLTTSSNSSLHSLNAEAQSQSHDVHQMKTNQHLKKAYYQGLTKFLLSSS